MSILDKHDSEKIRVLHIGNIANNAYLNAKILNDDGVDCDVLCSDYYHVMANPEWEDADFAGDVDSEFFPNWNTVDLHGFRRPKWFAQGWFVFCVLYLIARRKKNWLMVKFWWFALSLSCFIERHPILKRYIENVWGTFKAHKIFQWTFIRSLSTALSDKVFSVDSAQKHKNPSSPSVNSPKVDSVFGALHGSYCKAFSRRKDHLVQNDIEPYSSRLYQLHHLFREYDIIHAYSTDPILPMLVDKHPYIAFEHGTIRSIPFEETSQGRLTALAYQLADGVVITNCDNKLAAENLNLTNYRFVPHPINEKWMQPGVGKKLREELIEELHTDFIIFHPARQHWEARRHPSWEKGNDIFIKGMADAIQSAQANIAAVLVEWGETVGASKKLLKETGIAHRVKWIKPQHSASMVRYIDACSLVADQFFLGAFGSTMPKALGMGRAAMLYLDEDMHRWCLPELPPIINAHTQEEVSEGLVRACRERAWLNDLAEDGRQWYRRYHSNKIIKDKLVDYYQAVLKPYRKEAQREA